MGGGHGDMHMEVSSAEWKGFTSNDGAHLFFGLPVMAYGHLIALDAYNALGKGRKVPKHAEGMFLLAFGFVIFVIDIFGYKGCDQTKGARTMCKDINEMHMLFGLFMMAIGAISLMHQYMRVFERASLWMTPMCLVVIGIFMMKHEQADDYGTFVHTAFGVSALAAALLRGLAIVDPTRWAIFTAYFSTVTALCFVSGSDSMDLLLGQRFMGHTVVLGVCTLAAILLVPFMLFIAWMNKGSYHHLLAERKDVDMPLLGGKF